MTYFVADANGDGGAFGTINGLKEFREWAQQHPGPLADFVVTGRTEDLPALVGALEGVSTSGHNEDMRQLLIGYASEADTVLYIHNGASDFGDDDDEDDDGADIEMALTAGEPPCEVDYDALEKMGDV